MVFTFQPPLFARLSGYIAEILSGLVLADLGIAHHPRPDHAAYIASWLEVLKNDPRAIFTAASKAQQAADWMHAQQPTPPTQEVVSSAQDGDDVADVGISAALLAA